ncbi:MAG: bifunctional 4-hydroxy-2-oxoglutarate aldolase/2-dehydro-3-deoxy-phosphogluconate aldolase [Bacteroidota bacterium]
MRPSRQQVNDLIDEHRFLPLFNPDSLEVTQRVLKAAYEGGVRLFELTNRSKNALEIFQQVFPFVQKQLPGLVLGAGTIMDETSARAFYEAGAAFIVSPVIPAQVARYCEGNHICWVPGASTLNEIVHAHQLGADMVKIFPANYLGGPGFVEAIKAPCPWIKVMPTGGVEGSEENLRAWFKAGVRCVGIGSHLFRKEKIAAGNFNSIREETQRITGIIQHIKSSLA